MVSFGPISSSPISGEEEVSSTVASVIYYYYLTFIAQIGEQIC